MYVGRTDCVKVRSQSEVQWMDSDQDLENSNIGIYVKQLLSIIEIDGNVYVLNG